MGGRGGDTVGRGGREQRRNIAKTTKIGVSIHGTRSVPHFFSASVSVASPSCVIKDERFFYLNHATSGGYVLPLQPAAPESFRSQPRPRSRSSQNMLQMCMYPFDPLDAGQARAPIPISRLLAIFCARVLYKLVGYSAFRRHNLPSTSSYGQQVCVFCSIFPYLVMIP